MYRRVKFIKNEYNLGQTMSRDIGILEVNVEYINNGFARHCKKINS